VSTPTVVYYDGLCGLCDRAVQFLLARDRAARLRFAPLQGATALASLPKALRTPPLETVVVVHHGERLTRSTAALVALRELGGTWGVAARMLGAVPQVIRDAAYEAISRRRARWFGRREACRLPSPGERERFLD
jgi:predicted DCC family thiol-disulfide oxidoreductase YuxK